jgi:hypothetical protein
LVSGSLRRFLVLEAFEQSHDLFVRDLLEVPVPEADSLELVRCEKADQIIGLGTQGLDALWRTDRYSENEPTGVQTTQGQERRVGRYAGGKTIVYEYGRACLKVGIRAPLTTKKVETPLDLGGLTASDPLQVVLRDAKGLHDAFVEDAHAAGGHGTDTELRLAGGSEFATITSNGASRRRDISAPTGTPPRGNTNTTGRSSL